MIKYVNTIKKLDYIKSLKTYTHIELMKVALREANKALKYKDVPIGAVVSFNGQIISKAHNQVERYNNTLFHAEYLAINKAIKKLGFKNLNTCNLYVTLEPCSMCAGAIVLARLKNLYFGTSDFKAGACGGLLNIIENKELNHQIKVYPDILKEESSLILKKFFKEIRLNGK
jgi:tRNA(adenine34) deaminase